jgi:DNA-directed RNA polymerase specialized sigma24 family protein
MNKIDYENIRSIRALCRQYFNLKELARKGDTVAHSILLDIQAGINSLTQRQREAIMLSLIFSFTQSETAEVMGVSQQRITFLTMSGLEGIKTFLIGERKREMTEGEKQFLLNYGDKFELSDGR